MQQSTWSAEQCAGLLNKAKRSPTGWKACCPAHEDKEPSLFLADGKDGLALRCYAGCDYKSIAEALESKGARLNGYRDRSDVFTEHFELGPYHSYWDYHNAAGALIMRVCRWEQSRGNKTIRPLTKTPDGWKWGHHPNPRPLFQLDRLTNEPDLPVVLVEGEKTALAAQRLFPTHIATTWPGGAGSTGQVDLAPLKGRDVVAIPDCDIPGRKAMSWMVTHLKDVAHSVRVVDPSRLAADLPSGWDMADALTEGRDVSRWLDPPAQLQPTTDLDLQFLTLGEFVQRPSISSHVRGVIPARSIIVVFGPPKGGKTFSVCDLTMHAAHGIDWHGCEIPRPMKVAYMVGEGVSGLRVRLKAWLEQHDSLTQTGEFRVLPVALSLPERASSLVEALREFGPDIVVTDTLNAYFGSGDENSTQDMSVWCTAVRYLRDTLECSVVVIHHTGHGDSGRERGSIVLRASADVLIQVAKDEGAGELVGFQVIAARDLEPMDAAIPLKLVRHETEWLDEDGKPLVTCVVRSADQPVTLPGRGGRPLGDAQSALLAVTQELARAAAADPSGEVFLVRQDVGALVKERHGLSRQSVSSAWQGLARRKLIRLVEPGAVAIRVRT